MAVRVRLNDGINLLVHADIEEFRKAYEEALKRSTSLEVENGEGKTRVLNPAQVLYFEDASGTNDDDDDALPDPSAAPAAADPGRLEVG